MPRRAWIFPPRTSRRNRKNRRRRRRKPGAAKRDSGDVARRVTPRAAPTVVTWTAEREIADAPQAAELQWRCDNQKAFILMTRLRVSVRPAGTNARLVRTCKRGKLFTCIYMMLGKVVQQNARG